MSGLVCSISGECSKIKPVRRALVVSGVLLASGFSWPSFGDEARGTASPPMRPQIRCESLRGRGVENSTITSARRIPASALLPSYCEVSATENGTEHDIKAVLPDAWSRRLYQQGGGGLDGVIGALLPEVVSGRGAGSAALRSGTLVLGNNGGHRDPSGLALINNAPAMERYAHKAIGIVRDFGTALARLYYGEVPKYAYYHGCSNGGRGALNAAAKYGDKFDAVIAGAPTLNTVGATAQLVMAAALPVKDKATLENVAAQAVQACDRLDGAADGIIGDWRACAFDPAADPAKAGALSPQAASAISALMKGLQLADGTLVNSGFGFGNLAGAVDTYAERARGMMGIVVLNDARWTPADFDLARDYPVMRQFLEEKHHFNPAPDALAAFLHAGKKIIVWHGSDDVVISHKDTIRMWQQLAVAAGADADENARLYIAPGVNHCHGGPGADVFDLYSPMVAWVENGTPPGPIKAVKREAATGKPFRSRPLCVHPKVPRYTGHGDLDAAASFVCS